MLYPQFKKIGIIAPAGKLSLEKIEAGVHFLRNSGKEVVIGTHACGPSPADYLSASAENRAEDLMRLWLDPGIDLLLPVRGGFGSAHLLPLLDWDALAMRYDLPLAGYSDITALHWAMERFCIGHPIVGPMLGKLPEAAQCADSVKYHALAFADMPYEIEADFRIWNDEMAQGLPLPGNLAVAATLCGTPYMPDTTGRILILEDLNEPVYKIDRYLTMLEQNGVFKKCAGVLFGDFLDCSGELEPLFRRVAACVDGPVLSGFPFGHGFPVATIDFHRSMSICGDHVLIQ